MDSLTEDIDQASTPKKMRLSRMNSREEMTVHIKNENREGQRQQLNSHCRHVRVHKMDFDRAHD